MPMRRALMQEAGGTQGILAPSQVGNAKITAGTLGIRKVVISKPQTPVNP